jgi:hypothetical protein
VTHPFNHRRGFTRNDELEDPLWRRGCETISVQFIEEEEGRGKSDSLGRERKEGRETHLPRSSPGSADSADASRVDLEEGTAERRGQGEKGVKERRGCQFLRSEGAAQLESVPQRRQPICRR